MFRPQHSIKLGLVVHVCSFSAYEVKVVDQGHFQLNIKFGANLGYMRSSLKVKQNKAITRHRNGLADKGTCCQA